MIACIFIVFVVTSMMLQVAYAQVMKEQKNAIMNMTGEMTRHMNRMTLMDSTCNERVNNEGDLGILPSCLNVIETFNNHMRQLFNETRDDMTSILLD